MELNDLFTTREAVDYLNSRLPGRPRPVTKRVLDYAATTGRLEPIRVGSRDYGRNGGALVIVFTKRMLDEYIERMDQAEAEPVRAAAEDTEGWLESGEALITVNQALQARGLEEISLELFNHYRYQTDRLPSRTLGKMGIFLRRDLDAFVAYLAELDEARQGFGGIEKAAAYVTEQLRERGIGRRVTKGTLNNYIYRDKVLAAERVGNLLVFAKDDLDRLVAHIVQKEQEKRARARRRKKKEE